MGKREDWINYFKAVNGREPSAEEIEAAKAEWTAPTAESAATQPTATSEAAAPQPAAQPQPTPESQQAPQPQPVAPVAAPPLQGTQEKPVQQLSQWFKAGDWKTGAGWANTIKPEGGLTATLAVVNIVLGLGWMLAASKLGSFKSLMTQIGSLSSLFGGGDTGLSDINSKLGTMTTLVWLLAIILVLLGLNTLWQFVNLHYDAYLLTGGTGISALAGLIIYFKLTGAMNDTMAPGTSSNMGEVLKALHDIVNGKTNAVTTPAVKFAQSVYDSISSSGFGVMLKNFVNNIISFEHTTLVVGIIGVVGVVFAVMGLTKGWGKQHNG